MEPVETIQNRGEQRSTLAQEGYVAGACRILGEGGVQADCRIHDPQTVGANQAHGAATQLFLNLALKFDALRTSFFESRRDHDCRFHARIDTFADNLWNRRRGCRHNRQVNLPGNLANARVCLEPADFGMARIDGVDSSFKRGVPEILENSSADRALTLGGPNEGYRIREKQGIEAGSGGSSCFFLHARYFMLEPGTCDTHKFLLWSPRWIAIQVNKQFL
jgi:hypothetical protein